MPSTPSTEEQASWSRSGENAAYTIPRTGVVPSEPTVSAEEEELSADPSEHYTHDDGTFDITQGMAGASIRSQSRDQRSSEGYQDHQKGDATQVGWVSSQGSQAETPSGQQYYPASQASTSIYEGYPASQSTGNQSYGYGQQYVTAGVYSAGPSSFGSSAGVYGAGHSSYGSLSSSSSVPPTPDNTVRKIRTRNPKRTYDELDKSIFAVFQLLMELLILDRI